MYSSSRSVTLCLLSLGLPLGEELEGCQVVQGLVGAEGVVDVLPVAKGWLDGEEVQVSVVALPELLGVGAVGPFHTSIELGGVGWEHKKADPVLLAGSLKVSHKLTAAVHLDSSQREGEALL